MITARLVNLGRNNINRTVNVKSTAALHKEIGSYLGSRGWSMNQDDTDEHKYFVSVGWGRIVGEVHIIPEIN